jgi:hypothetical protein
MGFTEKSQEDDPQVSLYTPREEPTHAEPF